MTMYGRQMLLIEFIEPMDLWMSAWTSETSHKTHLIDPESLKGNTGRTRCGRWNSVAAKVETPIAALSLVRNLCTLCARTLDDWERRRLAAVANAESRHEITPTDIEP